VCVCVCVCVCEERRRKDGGLEKRNHQTTINPTSPLPPPPPFFRVTSDGVADLLVRAGDRVKPGGRLVVGVGGAHGWSDAVRARADETIRVSDLVLNHRVARIVAAEALYRGFAILRGDPYHHV